jgi:phage terminase large subunit-like protein
MNYKTIINKYINDVTAGRITIGKYARLRVERHLKDMDTAYSRGMYFDEKAALKALTFFNFTKHAKGRNFAGQQFILSPWQAFDIWCIYGWKSAGGNRRFRYAYTDVGRKNGKTTFAAAQGLYLMMMDQEPGAEIYTVATKREQARICLDDARNIVKTSADLKKYAQIFQHSVTCETMGASMKSLSSDSNTLDGLNPHGVILDEFHAHKDDMVFGVMKSAMGARTNPLMLILTTAGFNRNVPCYNYRSVAMKVLEGTLQQDDLFASIHTLDVDDDWNDEAVWGKSNPNMDVSVTKRFLKEAYQEAKNNSDQLYNFLTKNLNIWTDSAEVWIERDKWDACNQGKEDLDGAECYGGLDLASVRDTNALALRFQKPDGSATYKLFYWMPEMNVEERVKNKGINYDRWIREGYVRTTPGNVTDYNYIKADILRLCETYKVRSIAYDRWNSSQLVVDLADQGVTMNPFGQGYASMSAPTKEFEKEVLKKQMNHEGNPVLTWNMSNVHIQRDPAGNVKLDKGKSSEKVDGAVACVMALGEYLTAIGGEKKADLNEIYSERGIRTI